MNVWIGAAIAIAAGFVIGAIGARIVRNLLARAGSEGAQAAAAPLASLVFSVAVIVGLVVGLGIVQPDSLETIPQDLVSALPRFLAALIVGLGGNIVASLARTATARAVRGSGAAERVAPSAVRFVILAFAAILAAAQLGIDTTIINIAVSALLFGSAAAMALLIGLGGRNVASHVAAGRAWRQTLTVGDSLTLRSAAGEQISGTVIALHPTAIELDDSGHRMLVPNAQLLDVVVERQPADPT